MNLGSYLALKIAKEKIRLNCGRKTISQILLKFHLLLEVCQIFGYAIYEI